MSRHRPPHPPAPGARSARLSRAVGVVLLALVAAAVCGRYVTPSAPSVDAGDRPVALAVPRPGRGEQPSPAPMPGAAGLEPALRAALERAAGDAAGDGVPLVITSGLRTPEHQERLLAEAIAERGSRAEALRWVATPETSAHVAGEAVDIGPEEARAWLGASGAR